MMYAVIAPVLLSFAVIMLAAAGVQTPVHASFNAVLWVYFVGGIAALSCVAVAVARDLLARRVP